MRGAGSAFLCADLDLTPEIQDDFLLLASGASRSQVSIDNEIGTSLPTKISPTILRHAGCTDQFGKRSACLDGVEEETGRGCEIPVADNFEIGSKLS